jgi:hypothetical protein
MSQPAADETLKLEDRILPVWPANQKLQSSDDQKTVLIAQFEDAPLFNDALREAILKLADDPRYSGQYARHLGGTKHYRVDQWDTPVARFIDARAQAFFRLALQLPSAAVDMSWANVYRHGDYVLPHSHIRSTASLVYCVDEGDVAPDDSASGCFSVIDPRVRACCKLESDRMTNPLYPPLRTGSMIIFRSHVVHAVDPYSGTRPRITLSWNMNPTALPGSTYEMLGIR